MLNLEEFVRFFLYADNDIRASVVEILSSNQQPPSDSAANSDIDDKTR